MRYSQTDLMQHDKSSEREARGMGGGGEREMVTASIFEEQARGNGGWGGRRHGAY